MNFDRTLFAANVAAVISADGVLHPLELAQCELIKKHYKYTKTEWGKGEKLAATPGFVPKPTGTFADGAMNVEAMLRVAYADGDASEKEVKIIMDFCQAIGMTQEQLDNLNADVVNDVLHDPISCPACGTEVAPGAAFCSSCGAKIAADGGVKTEFEIPREGLAISFCESTAASFADALSLAKETSGFQEIERSKKKWYLATFSRDDMRWRKLVECVSAIRNREVFEDGEKKDWYELFSWKLMNCLRRRDSAYDKNVHCFFTSDDNGVNTYRNFNPWGCSCLEMSWTGYGNAWLRMGRWEKRMIGGLHWVFDKDRMRHAYGENSKEVRRCPFFTDVMERVIAALPDSVCPAKDRNWKYHETYESIIPGAVKVRVLRDYGIEVITTDGPEPTNLTVFRDIINRVFGAATAAAVVK